MSYLQSTAGLFLWLGTVGVGGERKSQLYTLNKYFGIACR